MRGEADYGQTTKERGRRNMIRTGIAGLLILLGTRSVAQGQNPTPSPAEARANAVRTPALPSETREKAWAILHEGLKDTNPDKRAKAARALGLLTGSAEAEKAAVFALKDRKPNVRLAAAVALGSMHAENAKGNLEEALGDSEPNVALASANSLLLLHDDVGYDTYYEVLRGEKRAGKGLIKEQLDTLKDKKKVAQMGFEEGIGFIPFGGIGYEIFKTVTKNDASPIRAAALDAIALREDASLVSRIVPSMDEKNDVVRFTAAACVAHLSGGLEKANGASDSKP